MNDIFPALQSWSNHYKSIAVATVIQTWGSSPRRVGAKMALTTDGDITGSVSGGCVEGAVVEAGEDVLRSGTPQLLHFGVADETAWEVGLACGGSIDLFVEPLSPALFSFWQEWITGQHVAVTVTVIRGPQELLGRRLYLKEDGISTGSLSPELDSIALESARAALNAGASRRVTFPSTSNGPSRQGNVEVFLEALLPQPTLVIVGGVHIAVALTALAKTLGYRTVVVDPRRAFGTEARFPHADQLVQAWPDEALRQVGINRTTAIAILSHDPKLDDPALTVALRSPAFYVGALGSKTTQAKRRARLMQAGFTAEELSRLHGPIGIEIGAQTPEEIALAILAEVTGVRNL